jgi:uroporphyrinogen decarboxylase
MTTKRERLKAAIAGELADRPPVALWRHFPVDDQDPHRLAQATGAFQVSFDFDFIKVSPSSSFCIKDWGAEDEWRGNPEGTRQYTKRVIQAPADWADLQPLDPHEGHLGAQLRCLQTLRESFGDSQPMIQTIFSPLSQAKNLVGPERLFEHLHQEPALVEQGLETITQTTAAYVEACVDVGVDGVFYAVQHASYHFFDQAGFQRFGERYDLEVLEAGSDLWLNVLHLHGEALIFEVATRYPVQVVNWHDRDTSPNLEQGRVVLRGAVCGGIRLSTMLLGDPDQVRREARQALGSVDGRGVVLGTGCVVPVHTPWGNIVAARDAVDFA